MDAPSVWSVSIVVLNFAGLYPGNLKYSLRQYLLATYGFHLQTIQEKRATYSAIMYPGRLFLRSRGRQLLCPAGIEDKWSSEEGEGTVELEVMSGRMMYAMNETTRRLRSDDPVDYK